MKFLLIYVPNLRFPIFHFDWNENYFGNICTIRSGIGFKADEYVEQGVPLLKIDNVGYGNIKWNNISYLPETYLKQYPFLKLNENDIVLALNRPITNNQLKISKLTSKDIPSILYQRVGKINVSSDYNLDYIYYLLTKNVFDFVLKTSIGSDQPFISTENLKKLIMKVPTITEQQKIGHFLSLIDQRIQTQIKIIDDYNSLKMGIYNWMFKENYADYKLKQLAYIVKGDQINNDQLLSNGSYYMMNGGTSPSGYLDSYNVSENTISISEGGNSCGYVQFNSSPFWSGGHCYTIQNVNSALIENKYLYHYLKHKEKEIMNLRIGTGLPNIQKKDLENFTIFVPSLLIQRKNLALFEMLDEKICILNEELERLEMQKKYLLRNMFI